MTKRSKRVRQVLRSGLKNVSSHVMHAPVKSLSITMLASMVTGIAIGYIIHK